jgi:hypothetical protein
MTYDQNAGIFIRLNLQTMIQRLVGCSECQAIARCFDEIEVLRFLTAEELANELVLCVTTLTSCRSNP